MLEYDSQRVFTGIPPLKLGTLVMLISLDEMRRACVGGRLEMKEAGYSRESNAFSISSTLLKGPILIFLMMPSESIRKVVGTYRM